MSRDRVRHSDVTPRRVRSRRGEVASAAPNSNTTTNARAGARSVVTCRGASIKYRCVLVAPTSGGAGMSSEAECEPIIERASVAAAAPPVSESVARHPPERPVDAEPSNSTLPAKPALGAGDDRETAAAVKMQSLQRRWAAARAAERERQRRAMFGDSEAEPV